MDNHTTAAAERVPQAAIDAANVCCELIESRYGERVRISMDAFRDAIAPHIAAQLAELRAKLEAAEKERDDLLNTAATLGQQVCRDKPRRDRLAAFEDERPVDEAWCRANGGKPEYDYQGVNFNRLVFNDGSGFVIDADFNTDGTSRIIVRRGAVVHGLLVSPTIGQLRHLLAALGGAK